MNDDALVRALWSTMAKAWASGDATRFATAFAEDVNFANVRGEDLKGRTAVAEAHAHLFSTTFHNTQIIPNFLLQRPLTDDIHLVHVTTAIVPLGILTHAQAVVTRQNKMWKITAFHNMIPNTPKGPTT
jgi:uncharacterized protein (TIGR02246 family)